MQGSRSIDGLRAWDAIVLSPGEAEAHAALFLGLDERRVLVHRGRVAGELGRHGVEPLRRETAG